MKTGLLLFLSLLTFAFACKERQTALTDSNQTTASYTTKKITLTNQTPTVDLPDFTLITANGEDHEKDAAKILQLKRRWPLAMQSLDPLAFDSILSSNFTFNGERFFNRADYISNRTTPGDWKITFVRYSNVTLQFFNDRGILSYVNRITNHNTKTDSIEYEHISWVDIYRKENSQWKLEAAHAIDYRMETKEMTEKPAQQYSRNSIPARFPRYAKQICHLAIFITDKKNSNHPAIKNKPPNGVIIPIPVIPTLPVAFIAVRRYSEPENSTIPMIKQ